MMMIPLIAVIQGFSFRLNCEYVGSSITERQAEVFSDAPSPSRFLVGTSGPNRSVRSFQKPLPTVCGQGCPAQQNAPVSGEEFNVGGKGGKEPGGGGLWGWGWGKEHGGFVSEVR